MQEKKQSVNKNYSIGAFLNKHKKEVIIVSSIIGIIGITVLAGVGIRYKSLKKWLKKATVEDLKEVRNNAHSEWKQHTINDEYRGKLWGLIQYLDRKINESEWAGKTPKAPVYPREHGHNLYKRD
ncbi:MAG: hypothetical protein J6A63_06130 [Clostridia bacterium]|nr:hypothetical protein [Clostridia bacterium]